jgi:hypothetical protein
MGNKAKRAGGEAGQSEGANWGGEGDSAGEGRKKKKARAGPGAAAERAALPAAPVPGPDAVPGGAADGSDPAKKSKKKTKLGRKEREKLRLKAAKAQAQADEEAGRIAAGGAPRGEVAPGEGAPASTDKKKRYTVFVGNLPYDATQQDVFKHFDNFLREMVLDVRMQHDKGTGQFRGTVCAVHPPAARPCRTPCNEMRVRILPGAASANAFARAFLTSLSYLHENAQCFVDLKDPIALSKAYKLHHSKIMDRQINVEPTVGGGGTGENRQRKMQEKKRELEKLRKKRISKEIQNPKEKKTR